MADPEDDKDDVEEPKDPYEGMRWLHPPKRSKWSIKDGILKVTIPKKTDLWRGTRFGFTKEDAPFYFKRVTGDFQVTCHIKGTFDQRYDQGGILIRASKTCYLKCGVEYFKDECYASTCVTNENSDWSLMPLPQKAKQAWFVIKRIGNCVQVYSSQDGVLYNQVRLAVLSDLPTVKVGLFGACPEGDGFKIYFQHFQVEEDFLDEEEYEEEGEHEEGEHEEGEHEEGEHEEGEHEGEDEEGEYVEDAATGDHKSVEPDEEHVQNEYEDEEEEEEEYLEDDVDGEDNSKSKGPPIVSIVDDDDDDELEVFE